MIAVAGAEIRDLFHPPSAMSTIPEYRVNFPQEKKTVHVLSGTPLIEALQRAGIILEYPCGGNGTCGKCGVRVEGGASKADSCDLDAFTEPELAAGWRLACRAEVSVDMEVQTEEAKKIRYLKTLETGFTSRRAYYPNIRRSKIRYEFPKIDNQNSFTAFVQEHFDKRVHFSYYSLLRLPRFINRDEKPFYIVYFEDGGGVNIVDLRYNKPKLFGIAIDIGTTSVVASLIDIGEQRVVDCCSQTNNQRTHGEDYLSRIDYAMKGKAGLKELQTLIVANLNTLVAELCKRNATTEDDIYEVVIAGNTVMQHFLLGLRVDDLAQIPFAAGFNTGTTISPKDIGLKLHRKSNVFVVPNLGSYVGADITAGVIVSGLHHSQEPRLLIDIGTNGEVVVGNRDFVRCTSAAAGPAFEGGNISCGMSATCGAIEKFIVDPNGGLAYNVIGKVRPTGLCGSGLIDLVAVLLEYGLIEETGKFVSPEDALRRGATEDLASRIIHAPNDQPKFAFALNDTAHPLYLTQKDISEIQLAKGAIYTAIEILLKEAGIALEELEKMYIAGGFGTFIRVPSAKKIGLIPDIPRDKLIFLGNSCLEGAQLMLLNSRYRDEAEKIAVKALNVVTANKTDFQERFSENIFFANAVK